MANNWGNPELKSFKNNYIRRVIVDQARVFVHKNIVVQTEDLLIRAAEAGAVFSDNHLPNQLPAYLIDDSKEGRLGLKFQIPNFFKKIETKDLGFSQVEDVFIYNADSEVETEDRESLYVDETPNKIGSETLLVGARGDAVKFIAYLLGLPDASQKFVFDDELSAGVRFMQSKLGIPETGIVDAYTWQSILPKGSERIAAGFAGIKVRTLQSALRVYGYGCPVTSRFGTETIKVVREFQRDNNLRITGRVGFLEWKLLFDLK